MSIKNKSTYIFNPGLLSQCWQRSHTGSCFSTSLSCTTCLLSHFAIMPLFPLPLYKTWQMEKDVQIRPSTTTTTTTATPETQTEKPSSCLMIGTSFTRLFGDGGVIIIIFLQTAATLSFPVVSDGVKIINGFQELARRGKIPIRPPYSTRLPV